MENLSIGIDIVNVDRFRKKPYSDNKQFYKKIFNHDEILYCQKYKDTYPHFAGKFAVKEALKKTFSKHISFLDIVTSNGKNGEPLINLKKKTKNIKFIVKSSQCNV